MRGKEAQDYVCGLAQMVKRVEEMAQSQAQEGTSIRYSSPRRVGLNMSELLGN